VNTQLSGIDSRSTVGLTDLPVVLQSDGRRVPDQSRSSSHIDPGPGELIDCRSAEAVQREARDACLVAGCAQVTVAEVASDDRSRAVEDPRTR